VSVRAYRPGAVRKRVNGAVRRETLPHRLRINGAVMSLDSQCGKAIRPVRPVR